MADKHDPYAALRVGDFRNLLAGGVLASVGSEMLALAVGWELYRRTHSALCLGLVGLVLFLPLLFVSLPAGHAADRYSRQGLFAAAQAVTALAAAALAALSYSDPTDSDRPVPWMFACLFVAGVAQACGRPARASLLPMVVPADALGNAVAWNSSGWQTASMAGPALGGLVVALAGTEAAAYTLAACCSFACAVLVLPIRPREAAARPGAVTLRSLLAGVRFIWRTKLILACITLDLFAVLLGGATALLPVYAKDILHVGPLGLGLLRAAPSLGALLTAVLMAHRPPFRRAGRALLWSVAGFGAATVVFGFSTDVVLSFCMLALTGALDNVSVVVRGTLVHTLTPDDMRGRVSAVNSVFIGTSNELGGFESGSTAWLFGPVASVVGGGVGAILVVLAVALCWPEVTRLGALGKPHPAPEGVVETEEDMVEARRPGRGEPDER
jgi:MFS family permease